MSTCLVAGGAGFIGSHLCLKLLEDNYKVICLDNLITGDKENISKLLNNPNFNYIQADVSDNLPEIEANYIFHLASPASPNKNSLKSYINFPVETLLANSKGTHNLLELSIKNKARFLYASSSEVYGDPEVSPQKESYFGNVNPNGIRSVYDEGKRFGEAITMAYFRRQNLDTRIIRIFNTYGPFMQKDDGRVVSNFINQAIAQKPITVYGDGSQTRSFCYVDDLVNGLSLAMFSDSSNGEVFNLGNPDEKTVLDLAEKIKKMTNSSSALVFESLPQDDPKIRKPDITKAKQILKWEPVVNLEEGLGKTINYFKSL